MKIPENNISHEYLLSVLDYNPDTGIFLWKKAVSRNIKVGKEAGSCFGGYRRIKLNNRNYAAHRLAWFYVHKVWPLGMIDHKDRNGENNKICNLRVATTQQNNFNHKRNPRSKSGYRGVYLMPDGKTYKVIAVLNYKHHYLGRFLDVELANQAHINFVKEHHGEYYADQANI